MHDMCAYFQHVNDTSDSSTPHMRAAKFQTFQVISATNIFATEPKRDMNYDTKYSLSRDEQDARHTAQI